MYWFQSPGSVVLNLFGFDIKYYGIMLFIAMVVGMVVSVCIAKYRYKMADTDVLVDFYPIMILVSIFFARLYYVVLSAGYYAEFPSEIFALWHGGISIHGAIIGGLLAGIIFFKYIKKTFVLLYADIISYGLCLGQAIGRWGNFFNSEAFGIPTDIWCKMYVMPAFRPIGYLSSQYFHPTFLYECLWNILIFLILFFVVGKYFKNRHGVVFFSYLILYSVGRFLIEGIRTDSVLNILNVPIAQWISILTIIISSITLCYLFKKR